MTNFALTFRKNLQRTQFKSQIQNKKLLAALFSPGISFGIAVLSPTFKLISLGSPKARASLPELSFRIPAVAPK
jgi:hypothetical protein